MEMKIAKYILKKEYHTIQHVGIYMASKYIHTIPLNKFLSA